MRKLGKIKLKNKSGKLFMQFFCFSRFLSNIFFKIHCHWMKIFPFGVQEKCFLLSFQNHHNTCLAVCQKLVSCHRIKSSRRTSLLRFGVNTGNLDCICSWWIYKMGKPSLFFGPNCGVQGSKIFFRVPLSLSLHGCGWALLIPLREK